MNYKNPAGILLNNKTNRYHPIIFRPSPMASHADKDLGCLRHKSLKHHTIGFASLKEAKQFILEQPNLLFYDITWEWDGNEIPAIVTWFENKITNL